MKNKTIVIMGGGTAGWISALYCLNKSKNLDLNLKVKLVSSNDIESIGVGEGTTRSFTNFIENVCKIDRREFLKETKGSFKYGIKFDNWNFDNNYYYHPFTCDSYYETRDEDLNYNFIQYAINNLNVPQKILQKKLHGTLFDLLENNKVSLKINDGYSYHFSANLVVSFFMKKCLEFNEFEHIRGTIHKVNYEEDGSIKNIVIDENKTTEGDFYINCLGFNSKNVLSNEYFDNEYYDNYILNNSAFAIQVKNSVSENLEPYTTSTAQEYGWTWKIPQYEKTGYGYVYSDSFTNDVDKLYEDIIKTYGIEEKNVFKTKIVKSKPYYNRKQIHKNCLSIGLSSGFVEPLEATSINMSLVSLNLFFKMIENEIHFNQKSLEIFNDKMKKDWTNVFKFIIFHYFTNNPINEYWKYYKNIQQNNEFEFYEKELDTRIFSKFSYFVVGLGMNIEDYSYDFSQEKYFRENVIDYFNIKTDLNTSQLYSLNEVLGEINKNSIGGNL